jgi:glycerol-3-phosphate dehydrogenase
MSDPVSACGRASALLEAGPVDLLVVGGGVVGAGIARDAALRGMRTLLVEQGDFASGTSSRSSRLLHGGLRYLAQGRIGLVREASVEKMRLSRNAPHLCQPLPFVFPIWKDTGWPLWQLAIGVRVYDLLCGGNNLGSSCSYLAKRLSGVVPGLMREGLSGGVRYFDALTNDARLVIDTLRSARDAGAAVLNYTSFVSSSRSGDGWTCVVLDQLGGHQTEVRARAVANATGAWAPRLQHSRVQLRLTKGVHLVIDRSRLPVSEAIVLPEGERILFAIPWGERVILGTTDTDYEGDPAAARTDHSDIHYILGVVNARFPEARLTPDCIIASWAGVRPLVSPRRLKQGSPSDISRRHEIRMAEPGWFDVTGGKLTAYRFIAEQAVDRIGRFLRMHLPPTQTARLPLTAGPYSGVLPPPIEQAVVQECCRHEWAVHLEDVLLRRTSWHFYHPNQLGTATAAARWMADELGWSPEQTAQELERYCQAAEFNPLATPGADAQGRGRAPQDISS